MAVSYFIRFVFLYLLEDDAVCVFFRLQSENEEKFLVLNSIY